MFGQMVENMKVNGKMENNMGKGNIYYLMGVLKLESGKKGKELKLVKTFELNSFGFERNLSI